MTWEPERSESDQDRSDRMHRENNPHYFKDDDLIPDTDDDPERDLPCQFCEDPDCDGDCEY